MLNEDAPSYQYRPGYNPQFLRRVKEKRAREARERAALEARQAVERKKRQEAEAMAPMSFRVIEIPSPSAIADYVPPSGTVQPAQCIIRHVANLYGVSYGDIIGPRRSREIVAARHVAVRAVADARPDMSLPMMGRVFKRDHTTLLAALKKTKQEGQPR